MHRIQESSPERIHVVLALLVCSCGWHAGCGFARILCNLRNKLRGKGNEVLCAKLSILDSFYPQNVLGVIVFVDLPKFGMAIIFTSDAGPRMVKIPVDELHKLKQKYKMYDVIIATFILCDFGKKFTLQNCIVVNITMLRC